MDCIALASLHTHALTHRRATPAEARHSHPSCQARSLARCQRSEDVKHLSLGPPHCAPTGEMARSAWRSRKTVIFAIWTELWRAVVAPFIFDSGALTQPGSPLGSETAKLRGGSGGLARRRKNIAALNLWRGIERDRQITWDLIRSLGSGLGVLALCRDVFAVDKIASLAKPRKNYRLGKIASRHTAKFYKWLAEYWHVLSP